MKNLLTFLFLFLIIPTFSQTTQLKSNNQRDTEIHFAYPTIFVHGLNGGAKTWADMEKKLTSIDWLYGGELRFNLDYDESPFTCDLFDDYKSFAHQTNQVGDFYIINFDVDRQGRIGGDLSNQSAIYKQGLAIRDAVKRVMELTGRNKVVLFGHSMGGLAIRQYLQTKEFWQFDNDHHVAKIVTTGTPHGGSDADVAVLQELLGIDDYSEAVRDLRKTYAYSPYEGVFLHGGFEWESVFKDHTVGEFYNIDVNCNTRIGDHVSGLNQRSIVQGVELAYIVGDAFLLGDGVVTTNSANWNKVYPNVRMEGLTVFKNHLALPNQEESNLLMLDESEYSNTAYQMLLNRTINGYITHQGDSGETTDYDIYRLNFPFAGTGRLTLGNAGHRDFNLTIVNSALDDIIFETAGSWDNQSFDFVDIRQGEEVYIIASATAEADYFYHAYNLQFDFFPSVITATTEVEKETIVIAPNPSNGQIQVLGTTKAAYYEVINMLGQRVRSGAFDSRLDLGVDAGFYWLRLMDKNGWLIEVKQLMIQR